MRTSRDQGALDASILCQSRKAQKCYLAMAAVLQHHASSRDTPLTRIPLPKRLRSAVSPYLSQKLTRPLVTKDGGVLRTILDARTYMLALSKDRERNARWQRAAELLLDGATVAAFSAALELALFYDAKLDVAAMAGRRALAGEP